MNRYWMIFSLAVILLQPNAADGSIISTLIKGMKKFVAKSWKSQDTSKKALSVVIPSVERGLALLSTMPESVYQMLDETKEDLRNLILDVVAKLWQSMGPKKAAVFGNIRKMNRLFRHLARFNATNIPWRRYGKRFGSGRRFSRSSMNDVWITGRPEGVFGKIMAYEIWPGPDFLKDILMPTRGINGSKLFPSSAPLLSITAYDDNDNAVNAEVEFTMDVSADSAPSGWITTSVGYECGFLDETSENISMYGCQVKNYVTGINVTCVCNHTTVFVVLMSVTSVTIPDGVKVVSYVVQSISIVLLVLTFALLLHVRKLIHGDRIAIQICLVFSLALLHTISLFHDLAVENSVSCVLVAVATHFFLLASAQWMLMEGTSLLMKTTNLVFQYGENARTIFWLRQVWCWGTSLVIVVVSVGAGLPKGSYLAVNPETTIGLNKNNTEVPRMYNQCWLAPSSPIFIGAVLVPLAIIIFVNFLVAIRLAYVVYKMGSESRKLRPMSQRQRHGHKEIIKTPHLTAAMKFVIALAPVFGLPWALGFAVGINEIVASEFFLYIHMIINGGQGVMIFILYCVIGTEIKAVLKRKLDRKLRSMEFWSRMFPDSSIKPNESTTRKATKNVQEACHGDTAETRFAGPDQNEGACHQSPLTEEAVKSVQTELRK